MNVCIVGALGVGRAHAIAAVNCGSTVLAIVDPQVEACIDAYCRGEVVNQWADIREAAILPPPTVTDTLASLPVKMRDAIDLFIIAAPDEHHAALTSEVLRLTDAKVLVEKPAWHVLDVVAPHDYSCVMVSCEWRYHKDIDAFRKARHFTYHNAIDLLSPSQQARAKSDPAYAIRDLGSHLLLMNDLPLESMSLCYSGRRLRINNGPSFTVGFTNQYQLSGDEIQLDWQMDLFERQLSAITDDRHPMLAHKSVRSALIAVQHWWQSAVKQEELKQENGNGIFDRSPSR